MEKVLIIEDDIDLTKIMKKFMEKEGYTVLTAENGKVGIEMFEKYKPDIVILDLMLPQIEGTEICIQIRKYSYVPIIVVSAKEEESDKLLSLGLGADDYLTKPFSMRELTARVKSHLRRFTKFSTQGEQEVLIFENLKIDNKSLEVSVNDDILSLTAKEYHLLYFLASHEGQVFTKNQIICQVWDYENGIDDNTVSVYVKRIREKLMKYQIDFVKTVWGTGYKWKSE